MKSDGEMWDAAKTDAEKEIVILTRRIRRLRQAIRIFELNKSDGVEWPDLRAVGGNKL